MRDRWVHIKCSFLEHQSWHERAKAAGMPLARYIRNLMDPPAERAAELLESVANPILCPRCDRIGVPSCPECRHHFFGEPLPP